MVFIRDSELSQKVFANVSPDAFHLIGHPFGKKLFGEKNMIMMFGDEHKSLRRRLAPLFQLKALGVYIDIQVCPLPAAPFVYRVWLRAAPAWLRAAPARSVEGRRDGNAHGRDVKRRHTTVEVGS